MQAVLLKRKRTVVILILGLLSAIGPFSIDMYLPGFPAIAKALGTSVDAVSYSLSSFFVGVCLGQLLCGPLLDRFGRKIPLCAGLLLYIAASIGCACSSSIEALIIFRFFQALGGCVGMVAPRAIIRDVFPLNENAKVFSLLILILGVSPIIAPTAGSYVIAHFGWHWVFVILAIITAIILLSVIFLLPESKKPDPGYSLKPRPILQNFITVFKVPQFYTYAFVGAVSASGLYAYLSGSPFVYIEYFKTTETQYGFIFAIIAGGLILCSQLNNIFLKRYTSEEIIKIALAVQTLFGLSFFIGTYFHLLNLYTTIVLIAGFLSCQGFSFPNSSALSMAPFSKHAGSASALMGALQMGMGALTSALVGLMKPNSPLVLAGIMAACAGTALLILFLGSAKISNTATREAVLEQDIGMLEKF